MSAWGHDCNTKQQCMAKCQIGFGIQEFQRMILYFRLSVCRLGKITVIWTMLGGRAFMEQYLRHNKISNFFHVTSIITYSKGTMVSIMVPTMKPPLKPRTDSRLQKGQGLVYFHGLADAKCVAAHSHVEQNPHVLIINFNKRHVQNLE